MAMVKNKSRLFHKMNKRLKISVGGATLCLANKMGDYFVALASSNFGSVSICSKPASARFESVLKMGCCKNVRRAPPLLFQVYFCHEP